MIIQVYDDDLLNGEGIREVVFLQGCPHHCLNCFNHETWEFKTETVESRGKDMDYIKHLTKKLFEPYIDGITITGGDPLAYQNITQFQTLAYLAKSMGKTVWVYTGYTFEYVKENYPKELSLIDVLCDGPFIEALKSPDKPWVGSSNQRVIDIQKSLKTNTVVLYAK